MRDRTLGIILIIACLIIGLLAGLISFPYVFGVQASVGEVVNTENCDVDTVETEAIREEILASDPPGPHPLTRGITSWQEVYILALDWPEYEEALLLQGSVNSLEELGELAEGGKYDTIHTIKKGTVIVNSYYKGNEIIFVRETLTKNRLVLHNGNGKPAILVSCGNPIRVPQKEVVVIPPPIIVVTPPPWTPPPWTPPPGPPPGCGPGTPSNINDSTECGPGTPSNID